MGLYLKGHLVGRTPLGTPAAGKPQLYAWKVQDEDGSRLEVLSSDLLGASGELVEIPVNPRVKTNRNQQTGQTTLMDAVTLWASSSAGASREEEEWTVPGRASAHYRSAPPAPPASPLTPSLAGSGGNGKSQ